VRHVVIACSGIGHINRGFETFAQELSSALGAFPELSTRLYTGAKTAQADATALACIKRTSSLAEFLASVMGRDPYFVEQFSFALAMLPRLLITPPDVIVASDGALCNILSKMRRVFRLKFKILFSNGGPYSTPYPACDHVHQVLRGEFQKGEHAGYPPSMQTLIPYGFAIPQDWQETDPSVTFQERRKLGLPTDRKIVISVGAINRSHKRMDYLVTEVGQIPAGQRPFVVILGQSDEETLDVLGLANRELGEDGYVARCVAVDEVRRYLRAADMFILCSLAEGFGRVIVEALAEGLPCVLHDAPFAREVGGPLSIRVDQTADGNLCHTIIHELTRPAQSENAAARHAFCCTEFSWACLAAQYRAMIESCSPHQ
jgi:1,2-diacylglycerol 3-alpha-glucosyltransferase